MKRLVILCLSVAVAAVDVFAAAEPAKTAEDLKREAAVAEFTAKMKAANYPALFEAAAKEFNVPADVLKGVAFAETRWEQFTWPTGETASPETGIPRPYGIMSLWDNQYFGHSLTEAAALVGKTPDELKQDAYQNIRGGAALLRKIYEATPKPNGTTETDIESWRYAIRQYCGIPEPDLNARHALDIYVFMSKGYHQYGIEWDARPVNLEPIREETRRIVAEEKAKREARAAATSNAVPASIPQLSANPNTGPEVPLARETNPVAGVQVSVVGKPTPAEPQPRNPWWLILAVLAVLAGSFLIKRFLVRPGRS